jgi:hypothetical protein
MKNKETFRSKTIKKSFDICIMDIKMEVEYLNKNDIFKLEEKIEKEKVVIKRPRFLSEDNFNCKPKMTSFEILNFEDASIRDNYFNNNKNINKVSPYQNKENNFTCQSQFEMNKIKFIEIADCIETIKTVPSAKIKRILSEEKVSNTNNILVEENEIYITNESISESSLSLEEDSYLGFNSYEPSIYKNIKKLHKFQNNIKNEKNFKTSDTSSSITSDSFELDIEYVKFDLIYI